MSEERVPKVGDSVMFTNSVGADYTALVTAVWSPSCINVVYASSDETKKDQYGRQIERATSVQRMADWTAHGNYFRYPDESKKEYKAPLES
ncbi:hypothetical protein BH09PAT1_BH09PAT1_2770 [soil metagenome]